VDEASDRRTQPGDRRTGADRRGDDPLPAGRPLVVGVPREVKPAEHRVAMTPDGVRELVHEGCEVLVEAGAGAGSAMGDDEYRRAGATVLTTAAEVWERAELVCKVKEPQASEAELLRPGLVLFTYLHLAAYPEVADALLQRRVTAIGYETVQLASGALPLLAPMSEVAGRMATQIGAHFLERHRGGRGILLGGVPGVRPARVVVLGAGNVGWNSAWIAQGMEAEVILLDRDLDRLRFVDQIHRGRIMTLASNRSAVERAVVEADLVIGAVLVAGGRAPQLVSADMVSAMKPGAVMVDVAIDQGGCFETSHETTHDDPVYEVHGVLHYCVGNMPGAVPHTSTHALTNASLPYVVAVATRGVAGAVARDPALALGVNVVDGHVVNATVAAALERPHRPVAEALALG
jgi:alanine dehydrogenase